MAKRRGNPNWGKPEPIGPIVPTITEFEQVVREYKLSPISISGRPACGSGPAATRTPNISPSLFWKRGGSRSNPRCKMSKCTG
jgi:hypothetical protein